MVLGSILWTAVVTGSEYRGIFRCNFGSWTLPEVNGTILYIKRQLSLGSTRKCT